MPKMGKKDIAMKSGMGGAAAIASKMYTDVTSPNVKKMVGEDMKRGLREPGAMKDLIRSRLGGRVGRMYRGM